MTGRKRLGHLGMIGVILVVIGIAYMPTWAAVPCLVATVALYVAVRWQRWHDRKLARR